MALKRKYGPPIPPKQDFVPPAPVAVLPSVDRIGAAIADLNPDAHYIPLPILSPAIRSSAVTVAHRCPAEFMWRYRYGLRMKGSYRTALSVGTAFHKMMEFLFKGLTREAAIGTLKHLVAQEEMRLLQATEAKTGLLPGGYDPAETIRKVGRDSLLARAMGLFVWDVVADKLGLEGMNTLSVERLIKLTLPQVRRPIVVKCDILLYDAPQRHVWFVDWKTTSQHPLDTATRYRYGIQAKLYRWGVQKWIDSGESPIWKRGGTDKPPRVIGALHIILQKPGIRLSGDDRDYTEHDHELKSGPRKGEIEKRREYVGEPRFENYVKRVDRWYRDRHAESAEDPPIICNWTRLADNRREGAELRGQLQYTGRLARTGIDLGTFYRVDSQCVSPAFGRCEFMPLCSVDPAAWAMTIGQAYEYDPEFIHEED